MSDPVRKFDNQNPATPRAAAQDELEAILREAAAARGPAGSNPTSVNTASPVPGLSPEPFGEAPTAGPPTPSGTIKYKRYVIDVPEAGPNLIPAYQIAPTVPLLVILGVIAFVLWAACPSGIELLRSRPLPESFGDASARWTLVLTAQRIDHFAAIAGRLPLSLEELDQNVSDIVTYQRLPDEQYQLQSPGREGMLVLKPRMDRQGFLAGAGELLRKGPRAAR